MNNLCVHLFVGLSFFLHFPQHFHIYDKIKKIPQNCCHLLTSCRFKLALLSFFLEHQNFIRLSSMKASAIQKTYEWVKDIIYIIKQNYCILYLVQEFTYHMCSSSINDRSQPLWKLCSLSIVLRQSWASTSLRTVCRTQTCSACKALKNLHDLEVFSPTALIYCLFM